MNKGNERHSRMNFLVLWIFSYILFIWQSIIRIRFIVNIVISKLAQFQYNLRQNMSLSIKVDRILK